MAKQSTHFFTAIPVPEPARKLLSDVQLFLKDEGLPYRQWTHEKDFHITLKFLGSVDGIRLAQVDQALQSAEKLSAFSLHINHIGAFGHPERPRVVWAGAKKHPMLEKLHKEVETSMYQHGFLRERRPYRPHITLAKKWDERIAGNWSWQMDDLLEKWNKQKTPLHHMQPVRIKQIALFRIFPDKTPKYRVESIYRLRKEE